MRGIKNIILFLLIFALFLGATVEISEGSIPLGIALMVIAVLLISRVKLGVAFVIKRAPLPMLIGALIVAADIAYNLLTHSKLGTLDIMTFLLGVSLIAQNIPNDDIRRMGRFSAYMAATFILLFLLFFSLFGYLNIDFTHRFDHYFVLLPSVFLIRLLGIPIQVIATETVSIQGVEEMSVIIGGPCSGLYSMFLLMGIMVAYSRIEQLERGTFYTMLLVAIGVAHVANLIRVAILYIVAYYLGEAAMYTAHVHLGWIIFVVVVTGLLFLLERMSRVTTPSTSS